ncbi:S-locus glycoprotein domain [Sesbania bispinosa]|nr:S-locus glycoprotein domain [Sesbania bispinosa]
MTLCSIVNSISNLGSAVLGDDGNLVLSSHGKKVWQSFENPADTYVPGMKVPVKAASGKSFAFTSWKSATDPSPGNYTMGVDPEGLPQILVWEGQNRRWRSGYFTYEPFNDTKVRFQIGWDGYEREFGWNEGEKHWNEIQKGPSNECEVYNKCGSFAACDLSTSGSAICSCIRGFEPKHSDQWHKGNFSGGCQRMTPLKAERNASSGTEVNVGEDGFLVRRCMKLPDFARVVGTEDCEGNCLKNASCTAYANVLGIGCMAWYGELVDIQHFERGGNTLYIRLADSDLGDGGKKNKIVIISTVVGGLICLGIIVWVVWSFKGKLKALPTVSSASCCKNNDVLPVFDATKSREMSAEFSGSADLKENKLGQGGFGPVYKGKLPSGEEIAVKRLSRRSGQDPIKQAQLDWTRRFEIIEGIARGLLYLHRDSRLRIIHRDLKASNILLDENMNPKISDFGLARIFGGNQNEAIQPECGYMSPEYAMEGLFSVKSDVYSFGILLLEILSGRRNTSFRHSDDSSLIGYAWHLWNERRAMELIDPCIRDSSPKNKALRCIHIGMLCARFSSS